MKQEEIELTFCRTAIDSGLPLRLVETAYYVALGLRRPEIAKMRGVMASTVNNDIYEVYRSFGVSSPIQLIRVLLGAPAKYEEING